MTRTIIIAMCIDTFGALNNRRRHLVFDDANHIIWIPY